MKKQIFTGCATALITPFDASTENVDFSAFEDLIRFQINNGTDALVISGTTGESPVLSAKEKEVLLDIAINASRNRLPLIMGTGSNDTKTAVIKSNEAEKKGVDGLLIVTPYYNKATQEGIISHYNFIADRVSTPIIVYNVPSRTGVNILPETYLALSEHKNIVAIKEANGDISAAAKTIALCKNKLNIYSGNDDQTVAMLSLGAKGVISVAGNIIPSVMHKICRAMLSGNISTANKLQAEYLELINFLFCEVNPIPVKAACEMIFGCNSTLRLPLTPITEKNKNKLKTLLGKYKLI